MKKSGIEWTDATWNPIRGCSRISEGCRNCYAETVAARFSGAGQPYEGLAEFRVIGHGTDRERREAHWTGAVRLVEDRLEDPLRWKRPRKIFVNSMSDLFHEALPVQDLERVWRVMCSAVRQGHIFQVLTKRAERMAKWVPILMNRIFGPHWAMPAEIWLGVSVENQAAADARIPHLLQTPAAVRFLSCEPLLGPLDLAGLWSTCPGCGGSGSRAGFYFSEDNSGPCEDCNASGGFDEPQIDWVIAGGESGPGARPCDVAWIRSVVEQCQAAAVPVFVKQFGAFVRHNPPAAQWPAGTEFEHLEAQKGKTALRVCLKHKKGADLGEWPQDLRVREFPEVSHVG